MSREKANIISHEGVVEQVSLPVIRVRILQASACAACEAASLCRSSETKKKVVSALFIKGDVPSVGQRVRVVGRVSQGMTATVLAYVVPLFVMVGVLFGLTPSLGESMAALTALLCLGGWYLGLWLGRRRLARRLSFTVECLQNEITNN